MRPFKFFGVKEVNEADLNSRFDTFTPQSESEHKDAVDSSDKDLYSNDGVSISSGQDGVKKAQATTIVWTRKALIVAYAL